MIYVRKEENLGRENSRKSQVSTIQEYRTMNCMVKKRGEESKEITQNWTGPKNFNICFYE